MSGAGAEGFPCFIHSPFLQIQSSSGLKRRSPAIRSMTIKRPSKNFFILKLWRRREISFRFLYYLNREKINNRGERGYSPDARLRRATRALKSSSLRSSVFASNLLSVLILSTVGRKNRYPLRGYQFFLWRCFLIDVRTFFAENPEN